MLEDDLIYPLENLNFDDNFPDYRNPNNIIKKNIVKFLPPVLPSKIVCVGRNYAEHAAELSNSVPKEPLLF